MRTLSRYALVAAMTLAALLAASAPAGAATGRLVLHGPDLDSVITNPGPGCQSSVSAFSEVTNHTDVSVTVYSGIRCTGDAVVVTPGRTAPVGARHSVYIPA